MSQTIRQLPRSFTAVLAFACFLSLANDTPAQKNDDVTEKDRPQKIEADIRSALHDAQRLSATSTTGAIERLRSALTRLESDTTLPKNRREAIGRMLKDRIRAFEALAQEDASNIEQVPGRGGRSALEDSLVTDQVRVLRFQETIRKLVKAGKLPRDDGSDPVAQAVGRATATANQIEMNRRLRDERQQGLTRSLRDVERPSIFLKDDISYPREWKPRSKSRSSSDTALTTKERAIFRALNTNISVRFKDSHLEDVIEYLRVATGLSVVLDKASLEDADVRYDHPVSINVKNVSVRFLLRKILADLGLSYVIKDEVVQVMTPEKARSFMVVRAYPVSELSDSACGCLSPAEAALFMDMIQSTIDPASWASRGGNGTVTYDPVTRTFLVKQSAEFHGVLSRGLR